MTHCDVCGSAAKRGVVFMLFIVAPVCRRVTPAACRAARSTWGFAVAAYGTATSARHPLQWGRSR